MKILILLCFSVTLCCALGENRLKFTIHSFLDEAHTFMKGSKDRIHKVVNEIQRVKKRTKFDLDDLLESTHINDLLFVLNMKEARMAQIQSQLKRMKHMNTKLESCTNSVAENVSKVGQSLVDELEKCYNLALQSFNKSLARYDEVATAAKNLINDNAITDECLSENQKQMARCIFDQLLDVTLQFNKMVLDADTEVSETRFDVVQNQRECNSGPMMNINDMTDNAPEEMKDCFYKYGFDL